MSGLNVWLLGPPRIESEGVSLEISRRKGLALLAYLAMTRQRFQRDALATLLWPASSQSRARGNLRHVLSELNQMPGPVWLVFEDETVGLNQEVEIWLDVEQFRRHLAACQTHSHPIDDVCPDCLSPLTEAVELYRNDFLAGFTLRNSPEFDEWQFFQAEGLRRELASALERLVRGYSAEKQFEPAIEYARRWLALDPLYEPAHRHLMKLYARTGQRAAARRQYQECVRILAEELGGSPQAETTALYEHILAEETGDAEPLFPAPGSSVPPHNLPASLTPFVGREVELAEIHDRLQGPACRLLTLVGPGGCGKTRLAIEAAAAQMDNYPQGIFFVSLAPLDSVDSLVPTIAETLGFRFYEEGEPQQQLLDYLRQKRMLLILDNFEHLVESAVLVTELLQTAAEVKILATSRVRLNVQGEHPFAVAGMRFPDREIDTDATRYSAVRLFLSSVRRFQPEYEPSVDDLTAIARICRLVEGMPLAILLAATWMEILPPTEIAAEVGQSLNFFETDLRDLPERQRSLRAVFDHSWRLLSEREREIFRALSVFRGGFTREATQEVTGASLRELMVLVNKSLLHQVTKRRYEMHELLRQFAVEKLNQSPAAAGEAIRDRHSAHYCAALQRWAVDLKGSRQQTALREMDAEIENARAAWNWAVERSQVKRLDQAIEGLSLFYEWRNRYQEGEAACRMAADKLATVTAGDGPRVWGRTLAWRGVFSYELGRTRLASQLLKQCLALLTGPELADQDTRAEKAFALLQLGGIVVESDREEAKRLYEQSLLLYRALGDRWGTAKALEGLGFVAGHLGIYDEAKQLGEESLAIWQALSDSRGIADSLWLLATAALHQGQLEEAERFARESSTIRQEIGDRVSGSFGLGQLGGTLIRIGKFVEAYPLCKEALAIDRDIGYRHGLAWSNLTLGHVKAHLGQYDQAQAQLQVGLALSQEVGSQRVRGYSLHWLGCVALAGEKYTEAQQLFQESVAVYRELGQPEDLGWVLSGLGIAVHRLGNSRQTEQHLYEALRTTTEIQAFLPLMFALPALALILIDRDEKEWAVELYALASRYGYVANSRWFEDVIGRHIAAAAATLPAEVVAATQERGKARDLWATAAEFSVILKG